jgi:uncharacterized damage-inducible protein DinB
VVRAKIANAVWRRKEENIKTLTPEQALGLLNHYIEDYKEEREVTSKVLAALPDAAAEFRIEPNARPAADLAFHIAYAEAWFLESIFNGEFRPEQEVRPAHVKTPSDIAAWYEAQTAAWLPEVAGMTADQAAKVLSFYGMWEFPAAVFLGWLLKHTIHHRGQLSTYLRPAGGKVPRIYGGSFDEPMEMGG